MILFHSSKTIPVFQKLFFKNPANNKKIAIIIYNCCNSCLEPLMTDCIIFCPISKYSSLFKVLGEDNKQKITFHATSVFILFIKNSLIFYLQKALFVTDHFNSHCQKFICRVLILAGHAGCNLLFLLWKTWNSLLIKSFSLHKPEFSQFQRIWLFLVKI